MLVILSFSRLLPFVWSFLSFTAAQSNMCGTLGYHEQTKSSYFMGNFFHNGITSTLGLCAAYCKKDARCKTFRYSYWSDADAQYCEFFSTTVALNFTVDRTSPYSYYDIGCSFPPFEETRTTVTYIATIVSTTPAWTTTLTVTNAGATSTSISIQNVTAPTKTVTSTTSTTQTISSTTTRTVTAPIRIGGLIHGHLHSGSLMSVTNCQMSRFRGFAGKRAQTLQEVACIAWLAVMAKILVGYSQYAQNLLSYHRAEFSSRGQCILTVLTKMWDVSKVDSHLCASPSATPDRAPERRSRDYIAQTLRMTPWLSNPITRNDMG
ncbi:hypothetical protein C7974DRAFT_372050 [Boeremia exigua]|uniref:uncharacterized protein n=1 Tax=Boeremia exigua TaxID=749465 RepID=UPI001E8D1996|nr:uncharacterized protein C7974DRAFT_372050 [Boeremia exigua]KAH6642057.1 hypothetical protein C7974DRAFT_372050 [Boeremia exigua]